MRSYPLLQNTCMLRRPKEANFADIIKIAIMLIETTLTDSIVVKTIKKCIKMQFLSVFPNTTKIANFC